MSQPGSEPAIFSIEMKIEGMQIAPSTGTLGDRLLRFEAPFPPDAVELSNAIWYKHLELLFSGDNIQSFKRVSSELMAQS